MKIVTLSSKEKVHLKEVWTHKMEREFDTALFPAGSEIQDKVTVAAAYAAYDAVLPLIVDHIEKDGTSSTYTPDWFADLPLGDARAVKDAISDITAAERGKGKKNT